MAVLLAGCGSRAPAGDQPSQVPALAIADIARLEARRQAGLTDLIRIATETSEVNRALAIRGLGRVGGPRGLRALEQIVGRETGLAWVEAVRALALTGDGRAEAALVAAAGKASDPPARAALVDTLGRIGSRSSVDLIGPALRHDASSVRAAAAIALGVLGRREIPLTADVRAALGELSTADDVEVRYAAAYALAREHQPPADDAVTAALDRLSSDPDPEIRALALSGLARRKHADAAIYVHHLDDADWRVSVQAVRAISSEFVAERDRGQLAAWLARTWTGMDAAERGGPRIHAIVEGLSRLLPFSREPAVQAAARQIADAGGDREVVCRARAVVISGKPKVDGLLACADGQPGSWPAHEPARLTVEVMAHDLREHGDALRARVSDRDPQVRAAAITALGAFAQPVLSRALADDSVAVAGAAADVIAAMGKSGTRTPQLIAEALVVRAARARDPELRITMMAAIAAGKAPGDAVCRDALSDRNRSVRAAARDCVTALTGDDPGEGAASASPELPDVDPADVVGKRITWSVNTSRGAIEIELYPEAAPWHVAVLVSLTSKKFYDGLLWHRVVPDFVIQGGDPEGTGWGGPGFSIPGEPSGLPFGRGAVGIADAGLDTGGSQWFVMHSRAAHLEARYTLVGQVVRGQDVVDAIRVGDTIESATVSITTLAGD